MTSALIPNGKLQFIDINGKPLVAGTVGMYVPGTLIPKDTWQDAGQNVLNTNPVILDSRGQALIYGGGTYRQIVKDAQGNTIWDEETSAFGSGIDIALSFDTTADLLTAFGIGVSLTNGTFAVTIGRTAIGDNGGGEFYYNSSDTTTADNGGTIRVDSSGRRWYAVNKTAVAAELFGLGTSNSATDNDTALASAVTWISAQTNGGEITVENHTYNFGSATVSSSNVSFRGLGPDAELHSTNTTRTNGLNFHGASAVSPISGCGVFNLAITSHSVWSNGAVVDGQSTGAGIDTNFCNDFTVQNCYISNWSDGGIQIQDSKGCLITGNTVNETAQGIQIFAVTMDNFDNQIIGNYVKNTGLYDGIDVEASPPGTFKNYGTVVVGNWVDTSWNKGINIELSNRSTVTGNSVRASGQGSLQTPTPVDSSLWHGITLFGATNTTVTGNTSFSNAGYGISIYAGSNNAVLSGNTTTANNQGSCLVSDLSTASISNVSMGANNWNEGDIVTSGNVSFLTRTTGFTFSNIAISQSTTLDWYEEGTFTPVVKGTGTAGTGTYSKQSGSFTRIGNVVFFSIELAWSAHTGTGNIFLDGLPYSCGSVPSACSAFSNGLALTAANILQYSVTQATTQIAISQYSPTAGTAIDVPIDAVVTDLHVSGKYLMAT